MQKKFPSIAVEKSYRVLYSRIELYDHEGRGMLHEPISIGIATADDDCIVFDIPDAMELTAGRISLEPLPEKKRVSG